MILLHKKKKLYKDFNLIKINNTINMEEELKM